MRVQDEKGAEESFEIWSLQKPKLRENAQVQQGGPFRAGHPPEDPLQAIVTEWQEAEGAVGQQQDMTTASEGHQ